MLMYLYQFEDGALYTFEHSPTNGDKLAIENGTLTVYMVTQNGLTILGKGEVPSAVREEYDGQLYTVPPMEY